MDTDRPILNSRSWFRSRLGVLSIALALVLTSVVGCANRDRRPYSGAAEGTTIGRDLSRLPAGSVVPATSLGSDIVQQSPSRISPTDPALQPVGHESR